MQLPGQTRALVRKEKWHLLCVKSGTLMARGKGHVLQMKRST